VARDLRLRSRAST